MKHYSCGYSKVAQLLLYIDNHLMDMSMSAGIKILTNRPS